MLHDIKKHLKAKQYECITIDRETHLIRPASKETEDVDIDPVQLVVDFVTLISEYAKCQHLRVWHYPLPYIGVSNKEDQNRIASLNAHIFKEQALMIDALLAFVNKYGLFGIMNDEVMAYDYNHKNADGSYSLGEYPETAYTYREDAYQVEAKPYEEYIKRFFPEVQASDAIKLKGADRVCQYAEYMENILQNDRILACTEYISGIDKQNRSTLSIKRMNAALSFKDEVPSYDLRCRSLIEYCHSMFFLNEIAGEHKKVRICQYRRCHRPFIGRTAKYCCEACMRNANKSRKKGDQKNG